MTLNTPASLLLSVSLVSVCPLHLRGQDVIQPTPQTASPIECSSHERGLTLEDATAAALARNPGFLVLDAETDGARGEAQTQLVRPAPELSFGPGWKHVREAEGSHNEFKGTLGISQLIVFPGKRQLLAAIGQKNIEIRKAGVEALRFQVAAAVRVSFFELLAAESLLRLRQEQLEAAEAFHRATSKRVEASYASDFEAVKSLGEVLNATKLLRQAEARITTARIELNSLMGYDPEALLQITGVLDRPPVPQTTEHWVRIALEQNPGLRTLHMQAELAGLNLRKAKFSRKPDFSVGPTLEYSKSEQVFGISASVSLPSRNSNAGEILSASAEQRKALAEIEVLRREITGSVARCSAKLAAATAQLSLYTPAYLAQLKAVVAQAEQSYAQSITSLLVYLEAKRSYYDTQASYLEALGEVATSRAELEAAIGLGLESIPSKSSH